MNRKEIAAALEEMADLMEVKGENPFKVNAFRTAVRALPGIEGALTQESLSSTRGIGKSLTEIILTLQESGTHPLYEELRSSLPEGVRELLSIPGLGPKKVKILLDRVGVISPGILLYAIYQNRLLTLPGFGEKSQEKIRKSLERWQEHRHKLLLPQALDQAAALRRKVPGLIVSGSLRRLNPTHERLDLLLPRLQKDTLREYFPEGHWREEGDRLLGKVAQLPVTIHLYDTKEQETHLLLETTGSPEHLAALKDLAGRMDLPFPPSGESEEALYTTLGLPWFPPEVRESGDEVSLAASFHFSDLVKIGDLKGTVHVHTTWSDGAHTLEEMAETARALGWDYLGIADHSRSARYANGLSIERLAGQREAIEKMNRAMAHFRLLAGTECDILPDGSLDYPDEILADLDFVVASIHSHFHLTEEEQTERIVRAVSNPHVDILGHPTGRLLLARDGYPLAMERVLHAAAEHHTMIEINANPHRLDLDWHWIPRALELGIALIINPDAHKLEGLTDVGWGVMVGRKGLLTKEACANTWPIEKLREYWAENR